MNSESIKLSVIIPMYNVAQYVERCILSLEDQNLEKELYEIICINDGSPDNSGEIVKDLQKQFHNIVLIEQENRGVSMARNAGIDRASGRYLLFIDPDDFVQNNSLGSIIGEAELIDPEVFFLGFEFLDQFGSPSYGVLNSEQKGEIYDGISASEFSRGRGDIDPDRMWAILFSRDFFNKYSFRFLQNVPFLEDGELIARILCLAKRCAFYGDKFYIRTIRKNSATSSRLFYKKKSIDGFIMATKSLKAFRSDYQLNHEQIAYINKKILKFIVLTITSVTSLRSFRYSLHAYNSLKKNGLLKPDIKGVEGIYRKYGVYLRKSILLLQFYIVIEKIKTQFKLVTRKGVL